LEEKELEGDTTFLIEPKEGELQGDPNFDDRGIFPRSILESKRGTRDENIMHSQQDRKTQGKSPLERRGGPLCLWGTYYSSFHAQNLIEI
jgi:hypothetical protein